MAGMNLSLGLGFSRRPVSELLIPDLILDFTSVTTDLFSRASGATRWDESGVLQAVATDEPRYDHDPITGAALGLLVEESRTNILYPSNDFSSWPSNQVSISQTQTGPDGAISAWTMTDDGLGGSSGNCYVQLNGVTVSAGTSHVASLFVHAGNDSVIQIKTANDDAVRGGEFDVSTLSFSAIGTASGFIQPLGGGFYRCILIWTSGSDTNIALRIGFPSIVRDGSHSITIFGAQLEAGEFATSYIPTTTGPVTRAQDIPNIAAATMQYNAEGMGFALEGDITYVDGSRTYEATFLQWQDSSSDYIRWSLDTTSTRTGEVDFRQEESVSGVDICSSPIGEYSPGISVPFKIAARHGPLYVQGASNGVAFTENSTPTAWADLTSADLQLAKAFNGHLKTFKVWSQPVGSDVIAGATS